MEPRTVAGSQNGSKLAGKYLTFSLANEEYAIEILKVKEIIGMMSITTFPMMPDFVRGVINLRGKVIPVVDLRRRLLMDKIAYTDRTCTIVCEAGTIWMQKCWMVKKCGKKDCPAYENRDLRCWMASGTHCRGEIQGCYHEKIEACRKCDLYLTAHDQKTVFTVGIVVDSVSEVLSIKESEIEEPPRFGSKVNTDYILGMAKNNGNVKILLDIDKVLSSGGKSCLTNLSGA